MKRTADGTHEPGMRRAGQTDEPATTGPTQEAFDALAARVQAAEDQLPVYSQQISLMAGQIAQRKNALIRVGIGVNIPTPDIGPRYLLQTWRTTEPGPTTAEVLQVKAGDEARTVVKYTDAGTNRLEQHSPDLAPGYWQGTVYPSDGDMGQNSSDDFSGGGINFVGFFERLGAWKRQYVLKAVQGAVGDVMPVPISMPGAQVGDTVTVFGGNAMGSINRMWTTAESSDDEDDPLQPVDPDDGLFETTITVADEIQQLSDQDLSGNSYLFLLCRNPDQEADEPRDYFLSVTPSGSPFPGACQCAHSQVGDVVETVVEVAGRSFAEAGDKFEATISSAGEIQQTSEDALDLSGFLVFFSRPSTAPPAVGTPAPIFLDGVQQFDEIESAFRVDQESGELVELHPVSDYFLSPVGGSGLLQIAGNLEGAKIAFLIKREYSPP